MKNFIAERKLLYSLKGSDIRKDLVIRIGIPYLLEEGMVNFPFNEGVAGCPVEFDAAEKGTEGLFFSQPLLVLSFRSSPTHLP